MFQNVDSRLICEGDIFKVYISVYLGHFNRVGSVVDCYRLVHHFKDTLEICDCVYKGIHQVGEVHQRLPESRGIIRHCNDRTKRHHAAHSYKSNHKDERSDDDGHNIGTRPY